MQRLTDTELLAEIATAAQLLARVDSSAVDSILRQLDWGRRKLLGENVEPKPGPFTMGIIAVRELDGFPEADRIPLIQSELEAREPVVILSEEEKRRRKRAYRKAHTGSGLTSH